MSRRSGLVALILAAGLLAGAGCGGDDGATTSSTAAPAATAATTTDQLGVAEPEIVTGATTVPAATVTEPDAGDEEGIRVPADFTLADGALSPPQITVPPTLPIAVTVKAKDGQAHEVVFSTEPRVTVEVPAGGAGTARIPGQRKGTYTANIDGGPAVPALVAIDDAGP